MCLRDSFPYVVLVLTDLLGMAVPVNLVFLLVLAFILLLLLSLSSIVSGFAEKLKRLAQHNALLERRVRELEQQLGRTGSPGGPGGASSPDGPDGPAQ